MRKWQPSQRSLGPLTSGLPPVLALSSSGRSPRPFSSLLVAGFPSLSSWQRSASTEWNVSQSQAQLWQSNWGQRSWKEEWHYTVHLPSPRPGVRTCSRPVDDGVFHISSTFYSACQALCFIFPIAFPEINQSNTWSEASGIEKTVRPLTVPENRTAARPCLNSPLCEPGTASFKQAILEEGEENPDDEPLLFHFLLLLSRPALPERGSQLMLQSAGIGWKSLQRLSAQLSSAQSFGNGSSLCNKKILIL